MALYDDFFAEFPPVSKEEWLAQVAKDLKGRPVGELDWQVTEDWKISPFVYADDFAVAPAPLSAAPSAWEICETVHAADPVAANRQALEALEGGVEGLHFHLESEPDKAFFEHLFEGIYADYIGLHFSGAPASSNPGNLLTQLGRLAVSKKTEAAALRGSLACDPASGEGIIDWRYWAELASYAQQHFPGFSLITIAPDPAAADPVAELVSLLRKGNQYLLKLTERGMTAGDAARQLQFSIGIGENYFPEIARLRAFRMLWLHILKGWNAPLHYPQMAAFFRPDTYTEALYTNMIRATTMAMSAVLGGAGRLTVLPYDAGRETLASYPPAFGRRIARNVQHLLKMESFFQEAPDPAAGSYYIEQLTLQTAQRAWAQFQEGQ